MRVAIDASMLVALLNPTDTWHSQARVLRTEFAKINVEAIYFDCVVMEAVSAAARRLHEKGRFEDVEGMLGKLRKIAPRAQITWILPDAPRLFEEALMIIQVSRGELNFNDALIALACREHQIDWIASFDSDFDRIDWLKRIDSAQSLPSA